MNQLEKMVLKKLAKGPRWIRSLQLVKPIVLALVDQGLIEKVAPAGGTRRNMVQLTAAGQSAVFQMEGPDG